MKNLFKIEKATENTAFNIKYREFFTKYKFSFCNSAFLSYICTTIKKEQL